MPENRNEKIREIREWARQKYLDTGPWRWTGHIIVAEQIAFELSQRYHADQEAVEVAELLHDISKTEEADDKIHALLSVPIAETKMRELGFDEDFVAKVRACILTHSCEELKPQTLEAKIVASADAMSHFGQYLPMFWYHRPNEIIADKVRFSLIRIEKDWKKIQFDDAKEQIKPTYEALKLLLGNCPLNG
jgi:hypothetical protein